MARFNYVTLVGKEVEIWLVYDNKVKGKVKQVFEDVIIVEREADEIILKKSDVMLIKY